MLIITYKELEDEKVYLHPAASFQAIVCDDWFEDELVRTMIKDIDKTEVVGPHLLQSSVLGPIPPSRLSTGVKGLITMWKEKPATEQFYYMSSRYGQNCFKWIFYMSTFIDIKLMGNSFFHLPEDLIKGLDYKVYFEDYDYTATDIDDIDDKILRWGW